MEKDARKEQNRQKKKDSTDNRMGGLRNRDFIPGTQPYTRGRHDGTYRNTPASFAHPPCRQRHGSAALATTQEHEEKDERGRDLKKKKNIMALKGK